MQLQSKFLPLLSKEILQIKLQEVMKIQTIVILLKGNKMDCRPASAYLTLRIKIRRQKPGIRSYLEQRWAGVPWPTGR